MAVAIEFKSSVVSREHDKVTIALFDGEPEAECVAILECAPDAARALRENVGSALGSA